MKKFALLLVLLLLPLLALAESPAGMDGLALYQAGRYDEALPALEKMATGEGNMEAMFTLGEGWCSGVFGHTAYNLALEWYAQADAAGHYTAARRIAMLYYKGASSADGSVTFLSDHLKMLHYLEEKYAANTRDGYLLSWLGWLLCGNSPQNVCEPDYPRAVDVYVDAAYKGDSFSMMRLAEIMLDGHLGYIDAAEALEWYKMAHLAGEESAFSKVVDLYHKGLTADDGTVLLAPDDAAFLSYLEDLYFQGDLPVYGLSWLGWLLCGNSVQDVCEPDYARAFEVYKQGADQGDGYCMWQIGTLYEAGKLGHVDPVAAEAWFRKALAAGCTYAQDSLNELLAAQEK